MQHPLRNPRLLEVGKAERPSCVLRINHVAHTKGDRLPPDHYLIADKSREWAGFILPPGIAHRILIVKIVHEMAEAGGIACRSTAGRIRGIIGAIERVGWLVDEPFPHKEGVVLVQSIILVDLQK